MKQCSLVEATLRGVSGSQKSHSHTKHNEESSSIVILKPRRNIAHSKSCQASHAHIHRQTQTQTQTHTDTHTHTHHDCRRTAIINTGAVAVISDELSNTLQTPWSDTSQGFAFLSKSKLNTWSQAEADSKITGQERIGLTCYKALVKLYGQVEACEWSLKPTPNGFPKRMSVAFSGPRNPQDEDCGEKMNTGILQSLHDWLLGKVSNKLCRVAPTAISATCQTPITMSNLI